MLFKEENLKGLPPLYEQDGLGDKAKVHLAVTLGAYVWLITEYCPESELFFGFVCLNDVQNSELGYISLYELEELATKYPLKVEQIEMELSDAKDKYINS